MKTGAVEKATALYIFDLDFITPFGATLTFIRWHLHALLLGDAQLLLDSRVMGTNNLAHGTQTRAKTPGAICLLIVKALRSLAVACVPKAPEVPCCTVPPAQKKTRRGSPSPEAEQGKAFLQVCLQSSATLLCALGDGPLATPTHLQVNPAVGQSLQDVAGLPIMLVAWVAARLRDVAAVVLVPVGGTLQQAPQKCASSDCSSKMWLGLGNKLGPRPLAPPCAWELVTCGAAAHTCSTP